MFSVPRIEKDDVCVYMAMSTWMLRFQKKARALGSLSVSPFHHAPQLFSELTSDLSLVGRAGLSDWSGEKHLSHGCAISLDKMLHKNE